MTLNRVHVSLSVGLVLVLLLSVLYVQYRFSESVEAYARAAQGHDTATYIPGAPDNATRRVLNRILSEMLTRKMTNEERLSLAREGLDALSVSEQEIDAIGVLGENVTGALAVLDAQLTFLHRTKKEELLTVAARRFEIAADIRGLSYLANHHIAAIFNRVIQDGGELTAEHSLDLNKKIPEVEADFDKRTDLYRELEATAIDASHLVATLQLPWRKE